MRFLLIDVLYIYFSGKIRHVREMFPSFLFFFYYFSVVFYEEGGGRIEAAEEIDA